MCFIAMLIGCELDSTVDCPRPEYSFDNGSCVICFESQERFNAWWGECLLRGTDACGDCKDFL